MEITFKDMRSKIAGKNEILFFKQVEDSEVSFDLETM